MDELLMRRRVEGARVGHLGAAKDALEEQVGSRWLQRTQAIPHPVL